MSNLDLHLLLGNPEHSNISGEVLIAEESAVPFVLHSDFEDLTEGAREEIVQPHTTLSAAEDLRNYRIRSPPPITIWPALTSNRLSSDPYRGVLHWSLQLNPTRSKKPKTVPIHCPNFLQKNHCQHLCALESTDGTDADWRKLFKRLKMEGLTVEDCPSINQQRLRDCLERYLHNKTRVERLNLSTRVS